MTKDKTNMKTDKKIGDIKIRIENLKAEDKKVAELAQYFMEETYDQYQGFISAVVTARVLLETAYPMVKHFGDAIWDKILVEGIKLHLKELDNEENR